MTGANGASGYCEWLVPKSWYPEEVFGSVPALVRGPAAGVTGEKWNRENPSWPGLPPVGPSFTCTAHRNKLQATASVHWDALAYEAGQIVSLDGDLCAKS